MACTATLIRCDLEFEQLGHEALFCEQGRSCSASIWFAAACRDFMSRWQQDRSCRECSLGRPAAAAFVDQRVSRDLSRA